ncbi:UDP pyrophosphate phosphatase [Shigella flexneri]|nr:UDP pyrophosphate phosphatase [Shigella flexneri]
MSVYLYKKNLEGATLQGFILLENLFKPRQLYLQFPLCLELVP